MLFLWCWPDWGIAFGKWTDIESVDGSHDYDVMFIGVPTWSVTALA